MTSTSTSTPSLPPPQPPLQVDGIGHPKPVTAPFSQSLFAFVLAFIKSQPEGQTLDEYVARIQRQVIRDPNASSASGSLVIDSKEYWKVECDRLWRENKSLKDENKLIKNEVSLLKRQRHQRSNASRSNQHLHNSQEGEQFPEDNQGEELASRKRAFIDDYLEEFAFLRTNEASLHPQADSFVHTISTHIHKIISNREHLDTLLRSAASLPEIETLANFAPNVCLNLHSTLLECFLAVPYLKTDDENKHSLGMLTHISDLTIASFVSVFRALNKISQTIEGRKKKGKLVYEMVGFFNKSLHLIHTLSKLQLEHETTNRNLRSKRVRVQESEYVANKHLGKILSKIVYNLEWKENQSVHSELLEGIIYVVLDHTGMILSKLSFGEHVAACKNPGNITENDGDAVPEEPSKHEMQYAIQILHNVIGGSDKKELFLKVLGAGKQNAIQTRFSTFGTIPIPHGDLLKKVKVLLQSTLLKTTLGYDETESLHPPSTPEDVSGQVDGWNAEEIYGPRWYVAQMWSLIGWDLVE